ncbi:acyltransferase family protein [Sphingomonas sp. ID0503]|uniref:acyltransferase family protein n=1 Tax=Sphingomonas sp. ID0503 TaxID=3399691 RepID=UPI003AFAD64E
MGSQAAKGERFEVLDSLRGVCASMIVLLHFHTTGYIANSTLVSHGWMFVDFFFVLSGFVICASYGARLESGFPIGRFMWLRLGRIYPLHLFMLLVFLAFELAFWTGLMGGADRRPFEGSNSIGSFIASLFLVQIFYGPDGVANWNGVSWSIQAEMWTYLIFALLFRWTRGWVVAASIAVAVVAGLYVFLLTDRYLNVFHDGALARCLFGFSLGVVAYRIHAGRSQTVRPAFALATLGEAAAVIAVIALIVTAKSGPFSIAVPPLFFVVVSLFAREGGGISRLLKLRPFLLVGTLSYSIYMIHFFLQLRFINVLSAVERLSGGRIDIVGTVDGHNQVVASPLVSDALSLVVLALSIVAAHFTYTFIERPAQRWSREAKVGERRPRAEAVAEREAPTF